MRENCYRFTLERVLNGSAHRPYVYRQLVPAIANFITENIPKKIVTTVSQAYKYGPFRYYSNADANLNKFSDEYKFKWIIVYWIGFFSLLASLFFLREILNKREVTLFGKGAELRDHIHVRHAAELIAILIVNNYEKLETMFGEYWKEPFKKWFTENFNLPVKTVEWKRMMF